jgi:hypothetical protein
MLGNILALAPLATAILVYIAVGPVPASTRDLNTRLGRPRRWWPLAGRS